MSVTQQLSSRTVRHLAAECGFALAGVSTAQLSPDFHRFRGWAERGLAGEMRYLTDHRADLRASPENLLPGVRSVVSVGLLYNGPQPYSTDFTDPERAWISRYAWGDDYHVALRRKLTDLAHRLEEHEPFTWRICVDTAPLLERSLARDAGLGWIGKNTCLINQQQGSWFFLGELLTTLDLESDQPQPDRCGTCTRCIQACPTDALVPSKDGRYELDARLCISYFTIELRGPVPESHRAAIGHNIFGCDICQDVCPWNRKAGAVSSSESATGFQSRDRKGALGSGRPPEDTDLFAPSLEKMANLSQEEFKGLFRETPVTRAKYTGFLRNVAIAMGNSGQQQFRDPLTRLSNSEDPIVAEHAQWALGRLFATS